MKKTISINLGDRVFQIDEDAYQLLESYLEDLKSYFRKKSGQEDVVQDIESRLSELFDEKVRLGCRVITIEMAEEMIGRVGKPEELCDDEASEEQDPRQGKPQEEPVRKRLYRNPDDKILGGVASGIAAYLDWDPVWIRLLFVAAMLLWGIVIPLYLLLWVILPKAATAAQKLEMRGKRITVEDIGKTVTGSFERLNEEFNLQQNKTGIRKFLNGVLQLIGLLFKIALGILAALLCFPVLIAVLVLVAVGVALFVGLIMGGTTLLPSISFSHLPTIFHYPIADMLVVSGHHPAFLWMGLCAVCIVVLLPLVALFYAVAGRFTSLKPMNKAVKWALLALWLVGLGGAVYFFHQLSPFIVQLF